MNARPKFTVDPDLPQPGWRFYQPVDLLRVFTTPDGVARTLHMGVYQIVDDAMAEVGGTVWTSAGAGKFRSECGGYVIQPVSA